MSTVNSSGAGQELLTRMNDRVSAIASMPVASMAEQVAYRDAVEAALDAQVRDAAAFARDLRDRNVGQAAVVSMLAYRQALLTARERPGGALWRVVRGQAQRTLSASQLDVLQRSERIQVTQAASKESALAVWRRSQTVAETLVAAQRFEHDAARWREACVVGTLEGQPIYDARVVVDSAISEVMTDEQRGVWTTALAHAHTRSGFEQVRATQQPVVSETNGARQWAAQLQQPRTSETGPDLQ